MDTIDGTGESHGDPPDPPHPGPHFNHPSDVPGRIQRAWPAAAARPPPARRTGRHRATQARPAGVDMEQGRRRVGRYVEQRQPGQHQCDLRGGTWSRGGWGGGEKFCGAVQARAQVAGEGMQSRENREQGE